MKILINKNFEEYNDNLYINNKKISFQNGEKIKVDKRVKYIVPGFIDQHIHGGYGYDIMDNNIENYLQLKNNLPKEGTTGFLATTMTYDMNIIKEIIEKINEIKDEKGSIIYGIHLEGPYISKEFIGAQNPKYLKKPNIKEFEGINKTKLIKLVTYAPEEDDNLLFTKYLLKNKIIPSVGHSNAKVFEVNSAINEGLKNFTHFHNASSPHHHRHPGVVTSGLANRNINVELIVDGIHLHPDVVKMVYEIKGFENITLITDAMRAKAMDDGVYDLGGQKVNKIKNEARLEDGTLAGSVLKMNEAIKNMIDFTSCPINEAFLMASFNPAKLLGLKNVGLIKEDYDFNITMLDENFDVITTYINGEVVFNKEYDGN